MELQNGVITPARDEVSAHLQSFLRTSDFLHQLPSPVLDLRSDVVTQPTLEMWEAMCRIGFSGTPCADDLHVKELEAVGAALVGKESGLFVPTCTLANVLAMMTLGERGTQIILEESSHIATSEEWGLAYICGLVPRLLETTHDIFDVAQLRKVLEQKGVTHKLHTCLLCLENSHTFLGGKVLGVEQTRQLAALAKEYGAAVHLDGARLFNAATALGVSPKILADPVDSVAFSLNKGLGAPYGALLCGTQKAIAAARLNACRIGAATIHKAGTLAAAGTVALRGYSHLADDHRHALQLAQLLTGIPEIDIDLSTVQTNLVRARLCSKKKTSREVGESLERQGILVLVRDERTLRFVFHRSINDDHVPVIARAVIAAVH